MNKQLLLIILLTSISFSIKAQVGFGTRTPSPVAVMDIVSTNKGFLPPRVALNSTNGLDVLNPITITTPAATNSLLVFNTAIANDVTPGYYYYTTDLGLPNRWVKIHDSPTWGVLGNGSTDPSINFIGTTDNQDFVFRRFNIRAGILNSAQRNTSYGVSALNTTNTGLDNVAIGVANLASNTNGSSNIALGYQTLQNNTTNGNDNIAIGSLALSNNTTGKYNIGISGGSALSGNITGEGNIGLNWAALLNNSSGKYNIAIGESALQDANGNNNIALGVNALQQTNGNNNIGIGYISLQTNVVANNNNIAIGNYALWRNIATNNTAIGNEALGDESLDPFDNNTIGSGNNNTAFGHKSLANNRANSNNNTAAGSGAGSSATTGSNNTILGSNIDFLSNTGSNQLNIGNAIFGTNITNPTGNVGIAVNNPNSTLQINGSLSTMIRLLNSGTVANDDYTVLVNGNISLPAADTNNKGRIYFLVNNTTVGINIISGNFRDSNLNITNYPLSNGGTKGISVQSNGNQWQILSKF